MKTAITELLSLIPSGYDIKMYISENDPDEKMLDEWLFEKIYKNKNWLEKEKQQIIDAYRAGIGGESFEITCQDEVYFQRTYINPNYGDCSFEP